MLVQSAIAVTLQMDCHISVRIVGDYLISELLFLLSQPRLTETNPGYGGIATLLGSHPTLSLYPWAKATPHLSGRKFMGARLHLNASFKTQLAPLKIGVLRSLTAWLQARKITEAVEDSSGNAGASFAAYAARAGINARIFVPESAGGPKLQQIEAYGAELVTVPGSRSNASMQAIKAAGEGQAYASHAYLPFNLPGYATTSYEIFEQLGNQMPGAVILPAGQGGLLLGMARGFESLRIGNRIKNRETDYHWGAGA